MDFAYHRSLAPMMWALFAIASLELCVVHLLVALWSPAFAFALSIASFAGILWIAATIRSLKHLPVKLADGRLLMRVGRLKSIDLDARNVSGIREKWDAKALKDRSLLELSLIAYPNIVIDLISPVEHVFAGRRRTISSVAHRLDDPVAFIAALPCKDDRLIRG